MAISSITNQYQINGVLSTDDNVLRNLEKLCTASGCWLTRDVHRGKWAVIINRAEAVTATFDDSNIIGGISLVSSGLTELYNAVKLSYPSSDIDGQTDFVQVNLPASELNANEAPNTLEMTVELCNNTVQAQHLAQLELNQNRLDKLVTFESDYTALDIDAGDVIAITNGTHGWVDKKFRVISLSEVDGDTGDIRISITALEYDAVIYDTSIKRTVISNRTGIASIGSIGVTSKPTVRAIQKDARPRIEVTAFLPSGNGIVGGVEVWLFSSSKPVYELATTIYPAVGTFVGGTVVQTDIDYLPSGEGKIKLRCINGSVAGEFSDETAFSFTPIQTTDALVPSVSVLDASGNNILTTLTNTQLLKSLNDTVANGSSSNTSVFGRTFDIFSSKTDNNILVGEVPTVGVPTAVSVHSQVVSQTEIIQKFTDQIGTNYATTTNAGGVTPGLNTRIYPDQYWNSPASYGVTWNRGGKLLIVTVLTPFLNAEYDYLPPLLNQIQTNIAFGGHPTLQIYLAQGATFNKDSVIQRIYTSWTTPAITFQVQNPTPDTYWVGFAVEYIQGTNMYFPRTDNQGLQIVNPTAIYWYNPIYLHSSSEFAISQALFY